jgi:dTDP-4-dehydrorhamnose reductase
MKTVLITGGRGQLACALAALAPRFAARDYDLRKIGRPQFDFDRPATIDAVFAAAAPALVINAAGWTGVDRAEAEPAAAMRANASGPARLGESCLRAGIPLIHLSTDYVFDGDKGAPYRESDPPHPINVYGTTKRAGEEAILACGGRAVMLAAAQRHAVLRVVADQRGSPTSADDLAAAIFAIAVRIGDGWRDGDGGVFHAAGSGDTTWHGFASAIFAAAARFGRPVPEVEPITTAEWPTPARRPADSRLDCAKLEAVHGVRLPDWRPSLERTVAQICRANSR